MSKIEQILKKITPEVRRREIEKIKRVKLPPELEKWVEEYKSMEGERDDFIWKWTYNISRIITLSSVKKEYKKSAWETKFLMIMFVVLIDDVVDKHKNDKLLKELLKIPFYKSFVRFNKFDRKEKKYIKFVIKLWQNIENINRKYPRYNEFKEIAEFDIKQLLNSMEYAYLVNENNYLINRDEYNIYFSYNMQLITDIMIDLSCSLKFNLSELSIIRKISLHAQRMARIGNWITTWEREINEEDFTSGVFAYALEDGIIFLSDMKKSNKLKLIKKIKKSKIEKKLLEEWEDNYKEIKKLSNKIKTINIDDFLVSLEKVIFMHLVSRGYK